MSRQLIDKYEEGEESKLVLQLCLVLTCINLSQGRIMLIKLLAVATCIQRFTSSSASTSIFASESVTKLT